MNTESEEMNIEVLFRWVGKHFINADHETFNDMQLNFFYKELLTSSVCVYLLKQFDFRVPLQYVELLIIIALNIIKYFIFKEKKFEYFIISELILPRQM